MKSEKIYKSNENYLNLGNLITDKVLEIYNNPKNYLKNDNKLIKKFNNGKPRVKSNGVPEWTVLASLVALIPPELEKGEDDDNESILEEPRLKRQKLSDSQTDKETKEKEDNDKEVKDIIANYTIKPITITTGVKSLPTEIIENKSNGKLIHDMHAEILSIRLFNYILLEECIELKKGFISKSDLIEFDDHDDQNGENERKFKIKNGIKFALYISEIPCGDASIDNIREQSSDKQNWEDVNYIESKDGNNESVGDTKIATSGVIRGRENFSIVGKVRTKPGRKDSKLSNCKSCSDKLSLLQFKSIISAINFNQFTNNNSSKFKIENYLKFIILPKDKINDSSIQRCFYDRFFNKSNKLNKSYEDIENLMKDYNFQKITVIPTNSKFKDSKNVVDNSNIKQTPSNLSILYSPMNNYLDILNQGLKNGCFKKNYENINENDQVLITRFKLIKLLINNFKNDENSINDYNSFKDSLKNRQNLKKLIKFNLFDSWDDSINDNFKIKNLEI